MPNLDQFWKRALLWNSVGDWTLALIVFLAVFIGLLVLRQIFRARRRRWTEAGRPLPVALDLTAQLIEKTTPLFIWGVALYSAIEQLDFPPAIHLAHRIDHGVDVLITLIFWYQAARWAMATLRYSIDQRRRSTQGHDTALAGSMEIILFVAGVLIWDWRCCWRSTIWVWPSGRCSRDWASAVLPWPSRCRLYSATCSPRCPSPWTNPLCSAIC